MSLKKMICGVGMWSCMRRVIENMEWNGVAWNGVEWSGVEWNGLKNAS